MELPKAYDPKQVEDKMYQLWQESGFFNPDKLPGQRKKSYTIVIPPPNVTGSLHMGHALNATVQDILIRQKRMQGYKTLWVPGTDHAGIATQNVVEKQLKKEGKSRFDLGREKFIERIWQWKEEYGHIILGQLKKLGASCDWSRTRFTMDEGYVKAVEAAFLHYHQKGWIYQGKRVVNWCPRCATSLSDLELEYKEEKGSLWYIKYPIAQSDKFIVVATTRPETMLGDTAVAVNPNDKRYKDLVGKKVVLPLVNKEIPIVADRLVDQNFGTGAVKVTPAHDLTDQEIGQKHKLATVEAIDEQGRMTKNVPLPYQGIKTLEARQKVVEDLGKLGLLEKVEEYTHQVPKCYRCGTTVELIPSLQWFLKMDELAKLAIKAVKSGEVKFIPKRWEKLYFDWLNNIKDWCISRQLWWGHRIPAWRCQIKTPDQKVMGFHESIFRQVFDGKISTWRLRDHDFKVGDVVAFRNSGTKEIFGYGTITKAVKTTVGEIDLKDKTHYKTYKSRGELIKAFQRHNPSYEVNENTPVFAYTYTFKKIDANDGGCNRVIIATEKPEKCPNCGSVELAPETDVLDTWFSSALWPFATLGWPQKTADLKNFYPGDVLSTDRGIINLWVTRMIFSGMEFLKKPPFNKVYIHATVLTREGQRMSKSLGTGIDPLGLVEKYGADATRFGIAFQVMGGQDIRFVEDNIVMGRKFCNKLWNASRFVLMQVGQNVTLAKPKAKTAADKKIIKALDKTVKAVNKDLADFQFGQAAHALYDFFWHDLCDRYIEESKKQTDDNTKNLLLHVLLTSLKLLHPFVPFVTEEIYQKLPLQDKKYLIVEDWPI